MALLWERNQWIARRACEVLLECGVQTLPVDVLAVAQRLGVTVVDNREVDKLAPDEFGAGYCDGQRWYVVYTPSLPIGGIRFTIVHELGHILLGHSLADGICTEEKEEEADLFAARLLAPPGVLYALNAYSATSIALLCNLSHRCAEVQSKTMIHLLQRQNRAPEESETKLIAAFEEYIANNRLRPFRKDFHSGQNNSAGKLYHAVNTQIRRKPNLTINAQSD